MADLLSVLGEPMVRMNNAFYKRMRLLYGLMTLRLPPRVSVSGDVKQPTTQLCHACPALKHSTCTDM